LAFWFSNFAFLGDGIETTNETKIRQRWHHSSGHRQRQNFHGLRRSSHYRSDSRKSQTETLGAWQTVRAQGRLVSEDEFADIVLRATPDGSIVLLRDVGRIASTFGPASSFPLASAFTGCPK